MSRLPHRTCGQRGLVRDLRLPSQGRQEAGNRSGAGSRAGASGPESLSIASERFRRVATWTCPCGRAQHVIAD